MGLKFGNQDRGKATLDGIYNSEVGRLQAIQFQGFNVVGEVVFAMRSFEKVIGFCLSHK